MTVILGHTYKFFKQQELLTIKGVVLLCSLFGSVCFIKV